MPKKLELTGRIFGKLTVISESSRDAYRNIMWLCQCSCGNEKRIAGRSLTRGLTKSCGCLHTTHGETNTPLYTRWKRMKERCFNKNNKSYNRYGGRGITICKHWFAYENFRDDMGPTFNEKLTLDRMDVNGNYCPMNCRWATPKEQARNKTNNHFLTFQGETKTIAEWSEITGINNSTLAKRIRRGWDIERALTDKVKG